MAVKKRAKRAKKTAAKKPARKTTKKTKRRGRKPAGKKTAKKTVKRRKKGGRKKAAKKKVSRNVTAKKPGRKRAKSRAKAGLATAQAKPAKSKAPSRKKSILKTKAANALMAIKEYLTDNGIMFEVIKHSPSITAPQTAASAHISGNDFAKTVIVKADNNIIMVVEPANEKVDLESLKHQIHAHSIELASEAEFRDLFPSCELGAMPPLGNLYGIDVYVSEHLTRNDKIAFNAGTHSELVRISYSDFSNLVNPKIVYA